MVGKNKKPIVPWDGETIENVELTLPDGKKIFFGNVKISELTEMILSILE